MTPIKFFLVAGNLVYTVDHAGQTRLVCVSPTALDAKWVATSLAAYHDKPVEEFDGDTVPTIRFEVSQL